MSGIYEGVWIDYSRGTFSGLTLTLTSRNGAILTGLYLTCPPITMHALTNVAALSVFAHLCGSSLWRIVKYIAHQKKATYGDPHDGLTQAQRVILRNNNSATSAAIQYIQLGLSWRESAPQAVLRSLVLSTLAIVIAIASAGLGILSSKATLSGHSTGLLSSASCGVWIGNTFLDDARDLLMGNLLDANYADACYNATSGTRCSTSFVQPRLNWTLFTNTSCPFAASICSGGHMQAISMVSDLIDSRDGLGLNTPDDDRLFYRRVSTCAVINDTDATTHFSVTFGDRTTSDPFLGVSLGIVSEYNGSIYENYTFWYDERSADTQSGYILR